MAEAVSALGDYRKHVFIFTSAGKPLFMRYESEATDATALYGVLLVFMQGAALRSSAAAGQDRLRRLEASVPGSASTSPSRFAKVVFYFEERGELMYVMAVRTHARGAAAAAAALPRAESVLEEEEETVCRAQLHFCHMLLLSVAPTLQDVLAKSPGYDARALFSPADLVLLREALDGFEHSPALASGALPVLPVWGRHREIQQDGPPTVVAAGCGEVPTRLTELSAAGIDTCSLVEYLEYLVRTHCSTAAGGEENVVLCCLWYEERGNPLPTLVACVDRSAQLFTTPIPTGDVLLLLQFARAVVQRQRGEAWAPLALPGFSTSGYLWCHCGRLDEQQQRTAAGTAGSGGLLLVQVSVSERDFMALSGAASNVAEALGRVTVQRFLAPNTNGTPARPPPRQWGSATLLSVFSPPASTLVAHDGAQEAQEVERHREQWSRLLAASSSATSQATTPRERARLPTGAVGGAVAPPLSHTPAPAFFSILARREARHRQRRAVLQRNAATAVETLVGFHAVYRPAAGPAGGRADAPDGLPCAHHFYRCTTGAVGEIRRGGQSRQLPPDMNRLLAEARRRNRQPFCGDSDSGGGSPSKGYAQSPFTILQLDGDSAQRCYRVVLLTQPQSALLITQLCQSFYRSPDALTEAEKKAIAALATSLSGTERVGPGGAVLAAPVAYHFSHLLQAVQQSSLQELCVVVDAAATMEETWFCVMLTLHNLVR